MFKYFKRRWADIGEILIEIWSLITWTNFLWFILGAIIFSLFVIVIMQFEDYEESDKWESYIDDILKNY